MQELNCQENEHILEIGFGTGATIVELASRNKQTRFSGIEVNELMHQKAIKRIKLCGLANTIECHLNNQISALPFPENAFDKIYCESVLAILEGDDLPRLLAEIRRVLKPTGIFLFNETVWTSKASQEIIKKVNAFCKANYQIIQANPDYPRLQDWVNLLQTSGFDVHSKREIAKVDGDLKLKPNWQSFVSRIFSAWGKLRHGASLAGLDDVKNHLDVPSNIMEGVIIKSKPSILAKG